MTLPDSDDISQKHTTGKKLFVGGLHWSTTEKSLEEYMNKFGQTEYVKIVYDNYTGRSRGFGFIKFLDDCIIDKVINSGPHILNDKKIDPKPALPISNDPSIDDSLNESSQTCCKKIFVGGLKHDLTDDSIHNYFRTFGNITEIKFYYQRNTTIRRGFCFVEYDDAESAQKALESRYHKIGNETVEVKVAQRRPVKTTYSMKNYKLNQNYNPNFLTYYDFLPYFYVDQNQQPSSYNNLYYLMPYYYNYNMSPLISSNQSNNVSQISPNNSTLSPPSTPRNSKGVTLPLTQQ